MTGGLGLNMTLFLLGILVIGLTGPKLTRVASLLAEKTGWGQAVMGAVFIGATTSLSGSITSLTASWNGHPVFAVSNAIGGIGAQITFLAVADLTYKKANLEHAAASEANLMQTALLLVMLICPVLAMTGHPVSWFGIHPFSLILIAIYFTGIRMVYSAHKDPMWTPKKTKETVSEVIAEGQDKEKNMKFVWAQFFILALLVSMAGWILAKTGLVISESTGLSETIMGAIFTAVTTSVPELVVAVSAVRQGYLTLAVGDIIGGNVFDTLIVAASDIVYRAGSIYHAIEVDQAFIFALSILLTGILLMGLVRREKHGMANIGFESILMPLVYVGGFIFLIWG